MDSFLDFYPTVAAVLNIEMDHVDYFKSMAQIKHSFRAYIDKTVGCGCAVLNADDDNVCDMAEGFGGSVLTFGIRRAADVTAKNITYDRGRASFDLCHGSMKKHVTLAVCGEHNVYNALAAAACAILCGIPSGAIVTKRRLEFKGKLGGADVYDDYAHHPTEIAATLDAARQMGYDRVICVYQPHTYSRTKGLFDEFAAAGSTGRDIAVNDGKKIFSSWISDFYKEKNVKFFITNNFIIVPVEEISDYFEIKAKYRVKRSGSSSLGKNRVCDFLEFLGNNSLHDYKITGVRADGNKLFVSSERNLHRLSFSDGKNEYMFSLRNGEY